MKQGFLSQLLGAFGPQRQAPALAAPFASEDAAAAEMRELLERLRRPRGLWCPIYTREDRDAVWHKGKPVIGWDPHDWRLDHEGNALFRDAFGDSSSAFGWEIGHIQAPEDGGLEVLSNWRPQLIREAVPVVHREVAGSQARA
jgi:hypothetical protein